jgi:hypothetical protein
MCYTYVMDTQETFAIASPCQSGVATNEIECASYASSPERSWARTPEAVQDLALLAQHSAALYVCNITDQLTLHRSTSSRQLRLMHEAGLNASEQRDSGRPIRQPMEQADAGKRGIPDVNCGSPFLWYRHRRMSMKGSTVCAMA